MAWHLRIGYAVMFLVVFRILWGLWGGIHARFSAFVRGPKSVWDYATALLRRRHPHFAGHNPLGGWMVLVLLVLITVELGSGLFATDDIMTDGPLRQHVSRSAAKLATRIHHINFNMLLIAVGVHIAAVLGYLLVFRENLIVPMLSGYKKGFADDAAAHVPWWRAVVTAALAVGLVWSLVG